MPDGARRGTAGVLVLCLLGVAGCGEPEEVERDVEVTPSPQEQSEGEEGLSDEPVEYVVPAAAEDRCGVAEGLLELDEQASEQSETAAEQQLGERLELFADAFGQFAELASDETEQRHWEEAESAYREAHSFYLSAGEQTANDHFLALLAEAVGAGTDAFEAQQEEVQEECGVDLGDLIPER